MRIRAVYGEVRCAGGAIYGCHAWCAVCHGYTWLPFLPDGALAQPVCAGCGLSESWLLRDPDARPEWVH